MGESHLKSKMEIRKPTWLHGCGGLLRRRGFAGSGLSLCGGFLFGLFLWGFFLGGFGGFGLGYFGFFLLLFLLLSLLSFGIVFG